MQHRPAGEGVGGGARWGSPPRIGRCVAVVMGAVRADWPGRVSVVAGQIPGAGQVRGAGRGGRETPGSAPVPAAAARAPHGPREQLRAPGTEHRFPKASQGTWISLRWASVFPN